MVQFGVNISFQYATLSSTLQCSYSLRIFKVFEWKCFYNIMYKSAWNRPLSCYLVSWMVLSKNWRFLIVFVQIQKTEANFPPKIRTSFANFHGRNSACKQTSTSDTTTFFNDLWWSPIQSNSTEITEAILESKWRSKNGRFLTKFLS